MMAGVIGMGRDNLRQSKEGFSRMASLENQRDQFNAAQEQAEDAEAASMTAAGASTGAMVGMQAGAVGGPMGMALGALAGYLIAEWL